MTSPSPFGDPRGRQASPHAFGSPPRAPEHERPPGRGTAPWMIGGAVVVALGLILGAILWIAQASAPGGATDSAGGTGDDPGGTESSATDSSRSDGDATSSGTGDDDADLAAAEAAALGFTKSLFGLIDDPLEDFVCDAVAASEELEEVREELLDYAATSGLEDIWVESSAYSGEGIEVVLVARIDGDEEVSDPLTVIRESGEWRACIEVDY